MNELSRLEIDIVNALIKVESISFDDKFLKDILTKIPKGLTHKQINSAKNVINAINKIYNYNIRKKEHNWARDGIRDANTSFYGFHEDYESIDDCWLPNS